MIYIPEKFSKYKASYRVSEMFNELNWRIEMVFEWKEKRYHIEQKYSPIDITLEQAILCFFNWAFDAIQHVTGEFKPVQLVFDFKTGDILDSQTSDPS